MGRSLIIVLTFLLLGMAAPFAAAANEDASVSAIETFTTDISPSLDAILAEPCNGCCTATSCATSVAKLPDAENLAFGLPSSDPRKPYAGETLHLSISLGVPTPPPKSS